MKLSDKYFEAKEKLGLTGYYEPSLKPTLQFNDPMIVRFARNMDIKIKNNNTIMKVVHSACSMFDPPDDVDTVVITDEPSNTLSDDDIPV